MCFPLASSADSINPLLKGGRPLEMGMATASSSLSFVYHLFVMYPPSSLVWRWERRLLCSLCLKFSPTVLLFRLLSEWYHFVKNLRAGAWDSHTCLRERIAVRKG